MEAIYFPGWREQRPTYSIGDGQIGLHSPGILGIKLIPIQTVSATNRNPQLSSAGVQHVAVLVVVVIGNYVGDHAEQAHDGVVELRSGSRLRVRQTCIRIGSVTGIQWASASRGSDRTADQRVVRIRMGRRVGEAGGRHPVGCSLANAERMLVTEARVSGEADVRAELEGVLAFGPGKIVEQIVHRGLSIVTIDDALIESVENVPLRVRIADDSSALPREAPMEAVHGVRAQYRRIAHDKSLAVVIDDRFRWASGQKRGLRVVEIL